MLNYRCTIKSIQTKDGRVIAPSTRIDVVPWPEASANGGWRIAFLAGSEGKDGSRLSKIVLVVLNFRICLTPGMTYSYTAVRSISVVLGGCACGPRGKRVQIDGLLRRRRRSGRCE